ncbi:Uncharacterized mitochondrial protein AtMg00310 [Linum grandiflorum]
MSRLLRSPNSLVCQVLKGRYFPTGSLLFAKKGSCPSWGWSSILHGRDLLLQGSRWLVGNGTSIATLIDNWLPTSPPSSPMPLPMTHLIPPVVSGFIRNGDWDRSLLDKVFHPASAKLICSIPLPSIPIPDAWVWHYARNGLYSVPSGYRLAQNVTFPTKSVIGPSLVDPSMWGKIWATNLQPKLKFLLWKIFYNILPVRESLARRSVTTFSTACPVCGDEVESIYYLLVKCPLVLKLAHVCECESLLTDDLPITIWRRLHVVTPHLSEKLVYFWWRLWKSRNTVVFDYYQTSVFTLGGQFRHHWSEFAHRVHNNQSANVLTPSVPLPSFGELTVAAPANPSWKIFTDAALCNRTLRGSIGYVLLDQQDVFLEASGQTINSIMDPLVLEMLVIRNPILNIKARCAPLPGITLIHSDCAEAVKMLLGDSFDARTGGLFQECRLLLQQLPMVYITHIRRQYNSAAHLVAREALHYAGISSHPIDM